MQPTPSSAPPSIQCPPLHPIAVPDALPLFPAPKAPCLALSSLNAPLLLPRRVEGGGATLKAVVEVDEEGEARPAVPEGVKHHFAVEEAAAGPCTVHVGAVNCG